jgi:hypothetical protein
LETLVPQSEQSVSPLYPEPGYPNDLPVFDRLPEKPTVIDRAWEIGRSTACKFKEK